MSSEHKLKENLDHLSPNLTIFQDYWAKFKKIPTQKRNANPNLDIQVSNTQIPSLKFQNASFFLAMCLFSFLCEVEQQHGKLQSCI